MQDKEKIIKAINSKGLSNSLISIYYLIGKAVPFRAQRFPDGRVSNWYRSQFVEVYSVKPSGNYGQYGNAYGLYYRNGVRADARENNPEHSWCKRTDTEPQDVPCGSCGSWVLLDILGEPTCEPIKLLGLYDIIDFGKHKGKLLIDVIHEDWKWVKWAIYVCDRFFCDIDEVNQERQKDIVVLTPDDKLGFGKYAGKAIKEIYKIDPNYLSWMLENTEDFILDITNLNNI